MRLSVKQKFMEGSRRFPNHIRRFRMEKGLSQRELSYILGYKSVSSLSHLEGGFKLPSLRTAMKLEAGLQRFIGDIFPRLYNSLRGPVARRRVALFEKRRTKKGERIEQR